MRILVKAPFEVPDFSREPFSYDDLGRRSLAESMTWLFGQADDGLVVSLNAPWGEGKTSFLHLWKESIRDNPVVVPIYYNAFKHDFSRDAFVSLAATIHRALEEEFKEKASGTKKVEQIKYLKKAAAAVAIDLAKTGTSLAVASLTGGLVSSTGFIEWAQNAFRRLSFGALEHNANAQFEAYMRTEDTVQNYQKAIRDLLRWGSGEKTKRIVVLVDELDRCRPDFAVEVIEKVKHLFRVDNVHFLLAIHSEQLRRTLKMVYGVSDSDAAIYFRKFVDVEIQLPRLSGTSSEPGEYLRAVFHKMNLLAELPGIEDDIVEIDSLVSALNLNPRALNRVATYAALASAACGPEKAFRQRKIVLVIALLRVGAPKAYENIRRNGSFFKSVDSPLNGRVWDDLFAFFNTNAKQTASNVFIVASAVEVCRVLDMYDVPGAGVDQRGEGAGDPAV